MLLTMIYAQISNVFDPAWYEFSTTTSTFVANQLTAILRTSQAKIYAHAMQEP